MDFLGGRGGGVEDGMCFKGGSEGVWWEVYIKTGLCWAASRRSGDGWLGGQ